MRDADVVDRDVAGNVIWTADHDAHRARHLQFVRVYV